MRETKPYEYKNQRVMTTKQLAEAFGTEIKTIHENFSKCKESFVPGKHYYCLEGEEFNTFKSSLPDDLGDAAKSKNISQICVWTELGVNKHCKIINTDKAWERFEFLEETYFSTSTETEPAPTVLTPIEYKNQRILTTEQLARVYETDVKNIQMNFSNHKSNFTPEKHYFFLEGAELKAFKNHVNDIGMVQKNSSHLYLWTERGANKHCKIINNDKAWEQFDNLEETYFKVKEAQLPKTDDELIYIGFKKSIEKNERLEKIINEKDQIIKEQESKVIFADAVSVSNTSILVGELAKIIKQNGTDMGQNRLLSG